MADPDSDYAIANKACHWEDSAVSAALHFAAHDGHEGAAYTLRLTLVDGTAVEGVVIASGRNWVLLEQFAPPEGQQPWSRFYNAGHVLYAEIEF